MTALLPVGVRARLRLVVALLGCGAVVLALHVFVFNVDTDIGVEDRIYLNMIAKQYGVALDMQGRPVSWQQQLDTVRAVQDAVLSAAPDNTPLALDGGREPKDVFLARSGLCYDRSRVIEKMLGALGMKTRHIAMYQLAGRGKLATLLSRKVVSHAITEVQTVRGWMVVDSNARWISLGVDGMPRSLAQMQAALATAPIAFEQPQLQNEIYRQPFTFVYGLYSRHGRFYRTPLGKAIVNANFADTLDNLTD